MNTTRPLCLISTVTKAIISNYVFLDFVKFPFSIQDALTNSITSFHQLPFFSVLMQSRPHNLLRVCNSYPIFLVAIGNIYLHFMENDCWQTCLADYEFIVIRFSLIIAVFLISQQIIFKFLVPIRFNNSCFWKLENSAIQNLPWTAREVKMKSSKSSSS